MGKLAYSKYIDKSMSIIIYKFLLQDIQMIFTY